jgi:hypothetical protein
METGSHAGENFNVEDNDNDSVTIYVETGSVGFEIGDTFSISDDAEAKPFYFELCLDNGDFSAPLESPEHERTLVLSRGKFTSCSHYINGNDVAPLEPVDISFTVMVNDSAKFGYLLDWLEGNTVNGNTIVTTKGLHERLNLDSALLSFRDSTKKTCNIQYHITGDSETTCRVYNEVYFDLGALTMTEAEDGVNLTLAGKCYGTIYTQADFSAGNDVTA